jgi:hypothetical protein
MARRAQSHPHTVQAALRTTTETLAGALAYPTDTTPLWGDFEWRIARAVAAMHGVSPLLSRTLRWQGPGGWSEFLAEQAAHTAARHARLAELLQRIDTAARQASVALVPLKGAALHELGLYAPGERPMADVDLLVAPSEAQRAVRLIEAQRFRESFSNFRHRIFVPLERGTAATLGEHAGNYLKIELHTHIVEALPRRLAQVAGLLPQGSAAPGLNPYPSRAALMAHLLLHAAGGMASRTVRLIHLHDLALLSARMTSSDWQALGQHGSADGRTPPWWAFPPLALTARYYRYAVSAEALSTLAGACPPLLRLAARRWSLSDVSLSNLWIDAFPALVWARSPSEAVRYMVSRVRPDAEVEQVRRLTRETDVAAVQSDWHHLSQGRRMLRWLTSRPTRAETMHAIDAALAGAQ